MPTWSRPWWHSDTSILTCRASCCLGCADCSLVRTRAQVRSTSCEGSVQPSANARLSELARSHPLANAGDPPGASIESAPQPGSPKALNMFSRLREDLECIMERDPAARSRWEVMTCYSGLHALW